MPRQVQLGENLCVRVDRRLALRIEKLRGSLAPEGIELRMADVLRLALERGVELLEKKERAK